MDGRVHATVVFPRHRVEEGLVDIQVASDEASHLLNRAAAQIEQEHLPQAIQSIAAADTLVRLIGQDAWALAGDITDCPDGLSGPDGHAA
jgi:hypothetical protein